MARLSRRGRAVLRIAFPLVLILVLASSPLSTFLIELIPITLRRPRSTDPKLIYPAPKYESIYRWERNLAQHNLDLPSPEGRTGRYVKFSSQIKALGWNNCLNEVLMNAHLAYESGRTYVFQDYYWKLEYYPWQPVSYPSPQTPLNALLSGPTAGGPWDPDDPTPRSISDKWFSVVCPWPLRRRIYTTQVKPALANEPGDVIFDHWLRILRDAPERCIEIIPASRKIDSYPQVFDLWLWGSSRILPLWERFRDSPTSRLLEPSLIVGAAISNNHRRLFGPAHDNGSRNSFERMMAVHVRRGDFEDACVSMANWNSTFYGWNQLEFLPDAFVPPSGGTPGQTTPENIKTYGARCFPTMESMVQTVNEIRESHIGMSSSGGARHELDVIYVLTNAEKEWLEALTKMLRRNRWHAVVTSHDLELDQEQISVSMAVDMEIARRAAVFIGNGWSSLTSNIVHQRLAAGKEPNSIRFW